MICHDARTRIYALPAPVCGPFDLTQREAYLMPDRRNTVGGTPRCASFAMAPEDRHLALLRRPALQRQVKAEGFVDIEHQRGGNDPNLPANAIDGE